MFYVNAKLLKEFGKTVNEGTVLFKEGDTGNTMFVIHRGKVKITKVIEGFPQTLVILGDGQFFGEMAILNAENRSATATVISKSEILEIPKAGFELLMQKSPEMATSLIKAFSSRLADTNKMLNILFYQDDYSRVLLTLKHHADKKTPENNEPVSIQADPHVLGNQLNMAGPRVKKVIDDAVKAGVLVSQEEGYKVPQPRHLKYFLRYSLERQKMKKAA